jgi:hypothetical protein
VTRAIVEYRIRGTDRWLVVLGRADADGTDTYDELAAWVLSHISDAAECRPREHVTDNRGSLKSCAECGGSFVAHRRDARYCGPRCRQVASRARRRDLATPATTSGAGNETLADLLDRPDVGDAPSLSAREVFAAPDLPTPAAAMQASASRSGGRSSAPR